MNGVHVIGEMKHSETNVATQPASSEYVAHAHAPSCVTVAAITTPLTTDVSDPTSSSVVIGRL